MVTECGTSECGRHPEGGLGSLMPNVEVRPQTSSQNPPKLYTARPHFCPWHHSLHPSSDPLVEVVGFPITDVCQASIGSISHFSQWAMRSEQCWRHPKLQHKWWPSSEAAGLPSMCVIILDPDDLAKEISLATLRGDWIPQRLEYSRPLLITAEGHLARSCPR